MPLLSHDQIEERLAALPGWERLGESICRQYSFASFAESMTFVRRVADLAEKANHHPDILVEYSKVTLTLTSHDAGGLTERDLDLATRIDA
jgi:4a-hydroxytetrahydrobiopterin dehydratase